jgi:hypothetical protein
VTPIYEFVPKNLDFQEQISADFLVRNQKGVFLVTNGVRREFRNQKGGFLGTDGVRREFRNQKGGVLVTDGVRRREVAACEGAEEFPTHRNAAKKGMARSHPL